MKKGSDPFSRSMKDHHEVTREKGSDPFFTEEQQ